MISLFLVGCVSIIWWMFATGYTDFGEWFRGPQVLPSLVRKWARAGGIMMQNRDFQRDHVPDRCPHKHELNVLAMVLELGCTVDQINPEASKSMEVAARRYSLLQHAYDRPGTVIVNRRPPTRSPDERVEGQRVVRGCVNQISTEAIITAATMARFKKRLSGTHQVEHRGRKAFHAVGRGWGSS